MAELDLDAIAALVERTRSKDPSVHADLVAMHSDYADLVELHDVAAPALLAEVKRLRAAVPSWADLRDVLAAHRYTAATDVEFTNAVMALITGQQDGGESR